MSDTGTHRAPLRPLARPEGLADAAEPLRPQLRPERMSLEETLASVQDDRTRPEPRPEGLVRPLPEETLANATQEGILPQGETTLIGLFGGPDGSTALVRLPGGAIVRVAAGEQVAGGRVTAIDEDGLHLLRGGETLRLTMPG